MLFRSPLIFLTISLFFAGFPARAQPVLPSVEYEYADLADLSVNANIIVRAVVKKAIKVGRDRAPDQPQGKQRYYVIAETSALIRGKNGIAGTIRYIVDLPLDRKGKTQKIKKKSFLIFARSDSGKFDEIQLVAPDAQMPWTQARERQVRNIVRELVAKDAPPPIKSISSAFHVPGTIIGEGESQIFLETNVRMPVSIAVLRRSGQSRVWAVSLSEIIDEAARAPSRNTLLWYRLACFLPRRLPGSAVADGTAPNARKAREDYQFILNDLGACPRQRPDSYRPLL